MCVFPTFSHLLHIIYCVQNLFASEEHLQFFFFHQMGPTPIVENLLKDFLDSRAQTISQLSVCIRIRIGSIAKWVFTSKGFASAVWCITINIEREKKTKKKTSAAKVKNHKYKTETFTIKKN